MGFLKICQNASHEKWQKFCQCVRQIGEMLNDDDADAESEVWEDVMVHISLQLNVRMLLLVTLLTI